jgi:hypothetical protein
MLALTVFMKEKNAEVSWAGCGKGSVAILLASINVTGHNLRRKGFQSYLSKHWLR